MDLLLEQLSISKQHRFGRSSEKMKFKDEMELCFNEAEVLATEGAAEPELKEVCPKAYKRKKHKGKREEDLKNIPVTIIEHTLSEEQLRSTLGKKWRSLPGEVYKRLAETVGSYV